MSKLKDFKGLPIDWEMTPEEAVTLYLEWGNNWRKGERAPVKSGKDSSYYFVVDTWKEQPRVCLIERNSEQSRELWESELPEGVDEELVVWLGKHKGVYAPSEDLKAWLQARMFE